MRVIAVVAAVVLLLGAAAGGQRYVAMQAERDLLAVQVQTLGADLEATNADREKAFAGVLAAAKGISQNANPTFVMWNIPRTIEVGHHFALGLPDTFTVRIQFTATTPVRARVMNYAQFIAFETGRPTDAVTYPASTSLDQVFHDTEGCADYVLILDAAQPTTVTPNVTITRAPPTPPTGYCAN